MRHTKQDCACSTVGVAHIPVHTHTHTCHGRGSGLGGKCAAGGTGLRHLKILLACNAVLPGGTSSTAEVAGWKLQGGPGPPASLCRSINREWEVVET